jgi:hypothetical protein
MSMHDDLQAEQPQKRGMSTTAKVLLVLGSIAGIVMLVCCGGAAFFGYKFKDNIKAIADATSNDPVVVKQRTQEVINIEIPEEFSPVMTIGFPLGEFSMKEFVYNNKANPNFMLVILETNQPLQPGQTVQQQREAMMQGMRQGQQFSLDMQEESRETREFTISGEQVPFDIIKGKANGVPARQIVGIFPSRKGTIMLLMTVPESDYSDEKIAGMINSIRLPGDAKGETAPAKDSEESDEAAGEKMPEGAEETEGETESSSEPAKP